MRINEKTEAVTLDRTLSALADPTRRAILRRLTRGESRVTDVAKPFDMSLAAVSKHIRMLERAGLVERRRVWREHLVSFNPAPLEAAAAWISQQRAFWTSRLDALEALLTQQESPSKKPRNKKRASTTSGHER